MNVRIGDAERDESVTLLAQHFTAGRLSPAEHEDRRSRAVIAVIRSEIETLFADLPAPHPDMSAARPPQPTPAEIEAQQETPLSNALAVAGGVDLLLGIPAGVILGFALGLWWLLLPIAALFVVCMSLSELAKKRDLQD
jgi:uncharacterized protein DUF1707